MSGNFRVGPWLVEPSLNAISRDGTAFHIEPKVMEVLVCLAERAPEPVLKEKLIETVWHDTFVTDDVVKRAVSELRRVFEDDARESHIIQTIPKRGYRLVVPVEPVNLSGAISAGVPQSPVSTRATGTVGTKWMSALAFTALAAVIWGAVRYWPDRESPIDSVAVLPFTESDAGTTSELLGDGITSALIENLSQIPHLKVMSRNSIFHYKGREFDPRTVGGELNVQAILTGSIVQHGESFVLDAELVKTSDNSHIWGRQYNGKASDILTVQEELARTVSDKLRARLTGEEKNRIAKQGTSNPEAYSLYVKGSYSGDRWDAQAWKKALAYFQQAVEKDPVYAQAYAGMGNAYVALAFTHSVPFEEGIQKAKAAAHRALELDENLAEAYAALGAASYVNWEWEDAERETRRAVELNPNLAIAHQIQAFVLSTEGKVEQGLAEQKRALELDPLSFTSNQFMGLQEYHLSRNYDRAIEQLLKTIELAPNYPGIHDRLADCYLAKGEYDKAALEYQKALRLMAKDNQAQSLGRAYANGGYRSLLKAQIELWSDPKRPEDYDPYSVALNYSLLNERGNAFVWLDRAYTYAGTSGDRMLDVQTNPQLDNIRSDPRYKAFLGRMGLPP